MSSAGASSAMAAAAAAAAAAASSSNMSASFARPGQGSGQGPTGLPNAASNSTGNGLDPLSQQILLRTSTADQSHSHSISLPHSHRLGRNPSRSDAPTHSTGNGNTTQTSNYGHSRRISQITGTSIVSTGVPETKEKRRGSSFFNRLSILGGRKKDGPSSATGDTDTSDLGDLRSDGATRILMSPAASGYIPHHKEPVKYQRIRCIHKHNKEFGNLFLAQELTLAHDTANPGLAQNATPTTAPRSTRPELTSHDGAVWCMEWSQDGRYLAAAGQDGVVRVYAVLSQPEDRFNEEDNTPDPSHGTRLRAPVFTSKPVREFSGHEGEVLDLTWSKNGFLLSSSMDKSVRLWHLDYQENLCIFKHSDFVTSISFHPRDDRFFLAGSLDSTLRLWSIPDKAVAFQANVPDLITAVAFTPDGRTCIAGMLNGLCMFFETEGLKLEKEIHVRSSRGKNSKGSKITGIETLMNPGYGDDHGDGSVKVLITSNDSRIRLYNLRDKGLELKLKGHENVSSQIHSRLSDDGRYVVCGSEDKKVFIWPTTCTELDQKDKDKRPVEYFEAHDDIVTVAMFAPATTRRLVGASDDPVYDLCNPPPVKLISRDEECASQASTAPSTQRHMKPGESPAYIARAGHKDGNILVTSDKTGVIRVWRQDCALVKRRHENLSSNRLSTLTRTGSIMTRTSFASSAPYSRRTSMSQLHGAAAGAGIDAVAVAAAAEKSEQMHSEMINSWRHNVEEGSETRSSSVAPPASEASGQEGGRGGRARSTSRPHTPPYSEHAKEISVSHSPVSSVTSRDIQVPPTPSFSYDSIEESPEESDEGKVEQTKSGGEAVAAEPGSAPQEGLLGSIIRHWRGRPLALQPSLAPIPAEKTPTATAVPVPMAAPLDPPVVGVQKPSFDEDYVDEEVLATTPTPSNIHLLSPKSRAQRRHSAGPRTMLGSGHAGVREVPAVVLEERPRSAEGVVGKAEEEEKKKKKIKDEGASCAGCGRGEFTSRKLGGRVREFCAGCGMIAPVNRS